MGFDYSNLAIPKPVPRAKASRRIRRQSKRHASGQRLWNKITRERIKELGGMCMAAIYGVCKLVATDGHHKSPRSRGGKHVRENCLPVCRACHDWIGANRVEAKRMGLIE